MELLASTNPSQAESSRTADDEEPQHWRRPREPPSSLWQLLVLPWLERQEPRGRKERCAQISETIVEVPPLLSGAECEALLQAACRSLQREEGGKVEGAERSADGRLRAEEVKIRDLEDPRAVSIFETRVVEPLAAQIARSYGLATDGLRHLDAYIVRYTADYEAGTYAAHRDNSLVSAVVTLSGSGEYAGGGTRIDGDVYRPPRGGAVLFAGARVHRGVPIESGTRFILTIFFCDEAYGCRGCHLWTKDQNPLWKDSTLNASVVLDAAVATECLYLLWKAYCMYVA